MRRARHAIRGRLRSVRSRPRPQALAEAGVRPSATVDQDARRPAPRRPGARRGAGPGLAVASGSCLSRAAVADDWIDSGYLPAIRIGRGVPVKRSDFDALLEASYTGTKGPPAGGWDCDVPTPAAPAEDVKAGEPEPDKAAERSAG
jgi:hypothetical protein